MVSSENKNGANQVIITVIEDDLGLNQVIQKTLAKEGYLCQGFVTAKNALDWLVNNPDMYSLLLIDYFLEDTNGREFIQKARSLGVEAPFIIITGHGDERVAVEMMKMGAIDYLIKDQNFLNLIGAVIQQAINQLSTQKQLKESQQALRISENKYRSIFENIQDVYFEINTKGIAIEISPSILSVFQFKREELIGKELFKDPENLTAILDLLSENDEVADFEVLLTRKDTSRVHCSISCKFMPIHDESSSNIVGIIRDINQRKLAEENLRKEQENFQIIAESTSLMVARINWSGTYLYVSKACTKLLGYQPKELIGKAYNLFVHEEDLEQVNSNHVELLENSSESLAESYRVRRKDGSSIWLETYYHVLPNPKTHLVEEIVCVSRDITQEKEEEDLRKAKEVAEQASKAKSEFLANMSHEIRNPLNAIIGMTKTLEKTKLNTTQNNFLRSIMVSSEHLLRLLNDLLDFSQIESSTIELTLNNFNLRNTIEELLFSFKPQAQLKGIEVSFEFDQNIPDLLCGDEKKIVQILHNLLNNALKFTNNGAIDITAKLLSGSDESIRVEIGVQDTGIGVAEKDIPVIFEAFRQLDLSSKKEFPGSGLGLNIVKRLTELMNGQVSFTSKPGVGSRVVVEIPMTVARDNVQTPMFFINEQADREGSGPTKTLRILVAEDDAINQIYLAGFLKSQGWQVDVANNGLIALEKYESGTYDLILLDGQMPKMDGFDVTRKIREMENASGTRIPIVAITGYAIPGDKDRFLEAGMDDYITKPVDESRLLEVISRVVS
ncbi:MAG TPA: response regulator [Bacteroidales bacterium]|nr:response regulator [Bacteroidales bacterium]